MEVGNTEGIAFPDPSLKWVGWVWEHRSSRSTSQKQRDEIKDGQDCEASSFHPLREEWAEQIERWECLMGEAGRWDGGQRRRSLGRTSEAPALNRRQRLGWIQDFDLVYSLRNKTHEIQSSAKHFS